MKIVYEPGELERLQKRYDDLVSYGLSPLFDENEPRRLFGLTFRVTNPALASFVLSGLLNDRLLNFDIGIDVQSIEFNPASFNKEEVKHRLINSINDIFAG